MTERPHEVTVTRRALLVGFGVAAASAGLSGCSWLGRTPGPTVFRDATAPIEDRVESLLSQMTLPEKVGQMLQLNAENDLDEIVVERMAGSILHASQERLAQAHQLVARTRLQIPLIVADDVIHGYSFGRGATILPTQLAMACTWDPELVERGARMAAVEASADGMHWTFSPVLDVARDTRWGRVDETFGEDPYLIGELGAAMVRGYQGTGLNDPTALLACAKHFAGYSQTFGGRDASEFELSRRQLRSWFLPPYQRVAQAGARSFMLGYQSLDGVPVTVSNWLLNDVLRGEWGFTGTVTTDWDNVGSLIRDAKVATDMKHAAAMAVNASNDFIMTTPDFFDGAQEAIDAGLIKEEQIDAAVRRILHLKFSLGLFENPRTAKPDAATIIGQANHRELSLEQSRRSLVLLRNDGLLPLGPTTRKVAVVGVNGDDVQAQLGDWAFHSGQVRTLGDYNAGPLTYTVARGVDEFLGSNGDMTYVRGAGIGVSGPNEEGPDGQPVWGEFQPEPADPAEIAKAVDAVKASDVAVVVVGDNLSLTGEHKSTATLELMGGQKELLAAVAQTGKPFVVVVISGKPLILPEESTAHASAVIQAFNPGMHGGLAIAELLFGTINPAGRLPISIPRHAGQLPVVYNAVRGQHGYRYADLTQEPRHYFGEGLAYTTFEYGPITVENPELGPGDTLRARIDVRNSGSRQGRETVQLYIHDVVTSATWAGIELKAFTQVDLEPGQTKTVDFELPMSACTIVTADEKRVVESGDFELFIGHSARPSDLKQATFTIR